MDLHRQPSYRTQPLPRGELIGRFMFTADVVRSTGRVLREYGEIGEFGHEGLVFWTGVEMHRSTLFVSVVAPPTDHSRTGVFVDEAGYGKAVGAAHAQGLGLLAQIHSHPGSDARHSDGDDKLILMPFEGMLSIVVPRFGAGFTSIHDACVHQYQRGEWVLCSAESVADRFLELDTLSDVRFTDE